MNVPLRVMLRNTEFDRQRGLQMTGLQGRGLCAAAKETAAVDMIQAIQFFYEEMQSRRFMLNCVLIDGLPDWDDARRAVKTAEASSRFGRKKRVAAAKAKESAMLPSTFKAPALTVFSTIGLPVEAGGHGDFVSSTNYFVIAETCEIFEEMWICNSKYPDDLRERLGVSGYVPVVRVPRPDQELMRKLIEAL